MPDMTIAGLASVGGVGVETVRYYQRRGLLETPERPDRGGLAGGVRKYGPSDVRRLHFIRAAQAAGFTLEQVLELLSLDATQDRTRVRSLAAQRITALDAKIAELMAARVALQSLAYDCDTAAAGPCRS